MQRLKGDRAPRPFSPESLAAVQPGVMTRLCGNNSNPVNKNCDRTALRRLWTPAQGNWPAGQRAGEAPCGRDCRVALSPRLRCAVRGAPFCGAMKALGSPLLEGRAVCAAAGTWGCESARVGCSGTGPDPGLLCSYGCHTQIEKSNGCVGSGRYTASANTAVRHRSSVKKRPLPKGEELCMSISIVRVGERGMCGA